MAKSDKSWTKLSDAEDFGVMVAQAKSILEKENEKFRLMTAKNKEAAKKAANRGREYIPKPVAEVTDYIITVRDQNYKPESKKLARKACTSFVSTV